MKREGKELQPEQRQPEMFCFLLVAACESTLIKLVGR
jgi:hypothetical protein